MEREREREMYFLILIGKITRVRNCDNIRFFWRCKKGIKRYTRKKKRKKKRVRNVTENYFEYDEWKRINENVARLHPTFRGNPDRMVLYGSGARRRVLMIFSRVFCVLTCRRILLLLLLARDPETVWSAFRNRETDGLEELRVSSKR